MAASPSHLAANATAKPWRSSAANERAGSGCGAIREGPAGEDGSCLTATPAGPAKPSSSGGESRGLLQSGRSDQSHRAADVSRQRMRQARAKKFPPLI